MGLTDTQSRKLNTLADDFLKALTQALQGDPDPESIRISLAALAFCVSVILTRTRDVEFALFFEETLAGYMARWLDDEGGIKPTDVIN